MTYYCGKCGAEALYNVVSDRMVCFECDGSMRTGKILQAVAARANEMVQEKLAELVKQP